MAKKIEVKVSRDEIKTNKKLEKIFVIVIGIILIGLIVMSILDYIFVPAMLIMGGLESFAIGDYVRDDKDKKYLVYGLFGVGIVLLIISIIYLCMRTV